MRKALLLILLLLVSVAGAQSPNIPRDYAILSPSISFSDDNETFTVRFVVRNAGGNPGADTSIVIRNLLTQQVLTEDILPPIAGGASVEISIPFRTRDFNEGQLPIRIEVGLDAFEPEGSPLAGNNFIDISVTIPPMPARPTSPTPQPFDSFFEQIDGGFRMGGVFISYENFVIGLVIMLAGVLLLWILSILARAIFRRKPDFSAWQPSYAFMPMIDPNSVEGRRQAWQMHAQNGLILAPPTPNNLHVVKLLLGTDGELFNNWQVTGIRLSQYDNYGRVARTQYIASSGLTAQLNRLIRRRTKLKSDQLEKQVGRLARRLIGQFRRKINARTAFLPVALDLRLEGKHGEIRIVFELYQAQGGLWVRLDQWEPAMSVTSARIQESYTFTIHGMHGGEKLADYYKRLGDDVTWLLSQSLQVNKPQAQAPAPQPYAVPDTLTGMQPLSV
ncbi:MAG: hypothetical protein SNJ54_01615 [Anaerolineae bacterium]